MNLRIQKKQTEVAVLDIGSGKLSLMVGKKTEDGFIIVSQSECAYSGFVDGVILEEKKLYDSFATLLDSARRSYGKKIKELYVGVPGGFTSVVACEATLMSRFKKKFDTSDLTDIFNKANLYKDDANYRAINRSPIYYMINDETKTVDPVGEVGTKLTGLVSHVYADISFLTKVENILKNLGVSKIEFVSSCLAESWFLFDAKTRDNYVILIDIGYITTNIMLVCGDGIVYLKTFAIGSGHISADLCQVLNISYSLADDLRTKLNLNLEFDAEDVYQLKNGQTANAEKTNLIVKARIEDIAYYLSKCMADCPYTIDDKTPVYLTGGGLAYVKGGAEYLSFVLDKPVKTARSFNPLANKPQYSSVYGLIDIALKQI